MEASAPIRSLHHIAIRALDWDATNSFYQEALGYTRSLGWDFPGGRAAYLEAADGSCIEIFDFQEEPAQGVPAGPIMHYCVLVDDVDATYSEVKARGLRVVMEPFEGKITPSDGGEAVPTKACFFEGPNGEWIEFKQVESSR